MKASSSITPLTQQHQLLMNTLDGEHSARTSSPLTLARSAFQEAQNYRIRMWNKLKPAIGLLLGWDLLLSMQPRCWGVLGRSSSSELCSVCLVLRLRPQLYHFLAY